MNNSKNALPPVKGNPSSAQPMPGLGKRALALLAPKRQCFCTAIGQQADSDKRAGLRKANI